MKVADGIYELVKTLPEEQASQGLTFVESLQQSMATKDAPKRGRYLSDDAGILKDSPNFKGDPVELQRRMRDEWG